MRHLFYMDDDFGDVRQMSEVVKATLHPTDFDAAVGLESGWRSLRFFVKEGKEVWPDVIVMEARFTEGSALEVIRFIKSSPLAHLPVIVYTGTDDEDLKRACLAAGATKVFSKGPGTKGAESLTAYVSTLAPSRS